MPEGGVIQFLQAQVEAALSGNEFFSGGLLLGVLGAAAAMARNVPRRIWQLVKRQFSVSISVFDPAAMEWFSEWLITLPYGRRCRRVQIRARKFLSVGDEAWLRQEPSRGTHYFWWRRRLVRLEREKETPDGDSGGLEGASFQREYVTLTTWGRKTSFLTGIAEEVMLLAREKKESDVGKVFYYDRWGDWVLLNQVSPRELDSVVLDKGVMEDLIHDVETFYQSRDWYLNRGIPYRRGYLLEGPPGNGKSSAIRAIATHFNKPLYIMFASKKDDFKDIDVAASMARLPDGAVVVIEDIDVLVEAAKDRKKSDKSKKEGESGLTLSGLLNAIDGPTASESRVLFMTTNYPERLDKALIRPGRIDRRFHIGQPSTPQVKAMFRRFYPEAPAQAADSFVDNLVSDRPEALSMAALQGHLIANRDSSDQAIDRASEL